MNQINQIAIKWAKKLNFSEDWIEKIADYNYIGELIPYDFHNKELIAKKDKMLNLVSYLNYCEDIEKKFVEKGISEKILLDTLADIRIWAYRHKEIYGEYGVAEIVWLKWLPTMKMFTLGRLEYKMGRYLFFTPRKRLWLGKKIIEIHIPRGEKVTDENILSSLNHALEFFEKYFPEYKYDYFTCGSWMLDPNLKEILPESSGILAFQKHFDQVLYFPHIDHIRFVFGENVNKNNIKDFEPKTSLQKALKERILSKGKLGVGLSVIHKENIKKDKVISPKNKK